jgi:hypothetical protein
MHLPSHLHGGLPRKQLVVFSLKESDEEEADRYLGIEDFFSIWSDARGVPKSARPEASDVRAPLYQPTTMHNISRKLRVSKCARVGVVLLRMWGWTFGAVPFSKMNTPTDVVAWKNRLSRCQDRSTRYFQSSARWRQKHSARACCQTSA